MSDLLFDVPWYMPTFLGLFGIVVFWTGNNQLKTKLKTAGLAIIGLAIAWIALSVLVDTDKEKCRKGTEQLVAAVSASEWDTFSNSLDPDVNFGIQGGNGRRYAAGREQVTAFAKAGAKGISLTSASVSSSVATEVDPYITVVAHITSNQTTSGFPPSASSTFEFDWQRKGSGWAVHEIRLVRIFNQDGSALEEALRFVK